MVTKLIFAALASILVAFVIAASEAALSRLSRHRAGELFEEARRGASALATILADSAAYLSVASFVRVAAEATTAVLITLAVVDVVDGFWPDLLISIGVMVVVSFVIVGVSPRTLGRQHADRVALLSAPILVQLRRVLGPVARLLVMVANAVTPGRGYRDGPFESEAELGDLVDLAAGASMTTAGDRQGTAPAFGRGRTGAGAVMGPRTGDLDPGLVWFLSRAEGMTAGQLDSLVNHKSGLRAGPELRSESRCLPARHSTAVRAAEALHLPRSPQKQGFGRPAAPPDRRTRTDEDARHLSVQWLRYGVVSIGRPFRGRLRLAELY